MKRDIELEATFQQDQPGIQAALQALVDPLTRGDPTSPLRWTCKSRAKLAAALTEQGWRVSSTTVGRLLHRLGYRLQSARKRQEGATHPDRNAQFEHINQTADEHLAAGQPVVSVDTKKKELVGNFKNGGREWQPKGTPPAVLVHDFPTDAEGKAIPYGVYDMARNEAWVSVGWDHDTPAFAVASIRHWWHQMGCGAYPEATTLFITADAGGSNGYRLRAWKGTTLSGRRRQGVNRPDDAPAGRRKGASRVPQLARPTRSPRPGNPCASRMIPLESPVPEIGPPGSESGGRKRAYGSRTAARCESAGMSHRALPVTRLPSTLHESGRYPGHCPSGCGRGRHRCRSTPIGLQRADRALRNCRSRPARRPRAGFGSGRPAS